MSFEAYIAEAKELIMRETGMTQEQVELFLPKMEGALRKAHQQNIPISKSAGDVVAIVRAMGIERCIS